uniref:Integrase zinc-binding domain-containing protein n=1 Tax=Panagrolaimus sp. ES5 TaxID=591445 RepID=A0AC34FNZ1_9BILA
MKNGRFIENRLKSIKERVKVIKHVRTDQNPADIGSRGCDFDELARRKLWWHGPEFLLLEEENWPPEAVKAVVFDKDVSGNDCFELPKNPEMDISIKRKLDTTTFNVTSKKKKHDQPPASFDLPIDVERFSKWRTLVGTTAAVLYFTKQYWKYGESYIIERLMAVDCFSYNDPKMIELAELVIILNIQRKYPPSDLVIRNLKLRKNFYALYWEVSNRIPVTKITPALIWLPKCYETELLILDIHVKLHHAGPRHTLNEMRSKYWLCTGKAVANKVLHNNCGHCKLLKLKPYHLPPMPELHIIAFATIVEILIVTLLFKSLYWVFYFIF